MPSQEKIQEIQFLEQNLQNLLLQKQAFQIELTETASALKEIEASTEDIFKIIGQIMIKTDKKKMNAELSEKQKFFELRLKTIDKQESILTEKLEKLRDELMKEMKTK